MEVFGQQHYNGDGIVWSTARQGDESVWTVGPRYG
jgi:hypothetical protein